MRREKDTRNILELKPVQAVQWEMKENDSVVLLVPKFHNPVLVRFLLPRLRRPYFNVRLDEHGSFIWLRCNGSKTILEIAGEMREKYGESFDPDYSRITKFIRQMIKHEFVRT